MRIPKRTTSITLLIFVLLPILFPGFVLAGLDKALRVVDRNTHRHINVPRSDCDGYSLFASGREIPKFDLAVLLVRAALRDAEAIEFLRNRPPENANCPATQRWMRNNGWPELAELQRRASIGAPKLILHVEDGKDGLAEYVIHAGASGGRDDGDFPLFSWGSEWDHQMRSVLTSALPELAQLSTRQAIVERIRQFPEACREIEGGQGMAMKLTVTPAGHRSEITKVAIWACLEKEIDECTWSGSGFTAGQWGQLLDSCRAATQARIKSGAALDGAVLEHLEQTEDDLQH